jgi:uncharacterized delta-60 repeat protein
MRGKFTVLSFTASFAFANSLHAAPGDLDATFGTAGKFFTSIGGTTSSEPRTIATDVSGNIYVGAETLGASDDFSVIKLLPNGTLDTNFGSGGKVVVDLGAMSDDVLGGIAVDSSGNVFLAGASNANGGTAQFAVVKLTRAGAIDIGFGVNGRAYVPNPVTTANDSCCGITLDSDGDIYLIGASYPSGYQNLKVAKLLSTGVLDANFGMMGYTVANFGHSSTGNAAVIDSDSSVFVEGSVVTIDGGSASYHMALMHLDASGNVVTSFGTNGALLIDIGAVNLGAAIARDASGNFYLAGEVASANFLSQSFGVAKIDKNGGFVTDFGTGGKASFAIPAGNANANSVHVDKDGNLYVEGLATISNNAYTEVMHVDGAAGTLIPTFGTNGQATIDLLNGDYGGVGSALDPNGRLYVTALMGDPTSSTPNEFAAARLVTAPTNEIFSGSFE